MTIHEDKRGETNCGGWSAHLSLLRNVDGVSNVLGRRLLKGTSMGN